MILKHYNTNMNTDGKAVVKRRTNVELSFDGVQVAQLFWQLDGDEQAEFFNSLGLVDKLPMQLQSVADSKLLASCGRLAMSRIGEYSE